MLMNLIFNLNQISVKFYFYIKNCTNVAIFKEGSEPGENLIWSTRPRQLETPVKFTH